MTASRRAVADDAAPAPLPGANVTMKIGGVAYFAATTDGAVVLAGTRQNLQRRRVVVAHTYNGSRDSYQRWADAAAPAGGGKLRLLAAPQCASVGWASGRFIGSADAVGATSWEEYASRAAGCATPCVCPRARCAACSPPAAGPRSAWVARASTR